MNDRRILELFSDIVALGYDAKIEDPCTYANGEKGGWIRVTRGDREVRIFLDDPGWSWALWIGGEYAASGALDDLSSVLRAGVIAQSADRAINEIVIYWCDEQQVWAFNLWEDGALYSATIENLDELLDVMTADVDKISVRDKGGTMRDLSCLPNFGGEPPADTRGVWSWDPDRLLIGTSRDDYEIVRR